MRRKAVHTSGKRLLRVCGVLVVIYCLFFGVIKTFESSDAPPTNDTQPNRASIENLLLEDNPRLIDLNQVIDHKRCWTQLRTDQEYCLSYSAEYTEAHQSTRYKNALKKTMPPINTGYIGVWKTVYGSLYQRNPAALSQIADSLKRLAERRQLTRTQFARAVVSFVQDIPYWYILGERSCKNVKDKSFPCIDGIQFGLLTPTEVAYTAIGDCESKSLLLYSLLKTLGYQPMVLISKEYQHSLLALNISSSGEYIEYKGRLYYFWETTAKGWQSGMLPPSSSNKDYWRIALPPDFTPDNAYKTL